MFSFRSIYAVRAAMLKSEPSISSMRDPKIHPSVYWPMAPNAFRIALEEHRQRVKALWLRCERSGVSLPEAVRSLAQMDRYKYPDRF
jgi:hypothetical protein